MGVINAPRLLAENQLIASTMARKGQGIIRFQTPCFLIKGSASLISAYQKLRPAEGGNNASLNGG